MKNERIQVMVEIALAVALAAVLNAIRLWTMPMGGTVALNMVPIFVLALRRGLWPGMIAGALYGFVDLMLDPQIYYPLQVLLDYPVAYSLVGLAGLGSNVWHAKAAEGESMQAAGIALPFIVLGAFGRFAAHWLSGVVFFAQFAGDQPVWLYSLLYNGTYILPSLILSAAVTVAILPVLERAVPSRTAATRTLGGSAP